MNLLRRITKLETKQQTRGCPECERRSSGIRYVRDDGTPWREQDADRCPACGKAIECGHVICADPGAL